MARNAPEGFLRKLCKPFPQKGLSFARCFFQRTKLWTQLVVSKAVFSPRQKTMKKPG